MVFEHLIFVSLCPACEVPAAGWCVDCAREVRSWRGEGCSRCGAERPSECLCDQLPAQVTGVRSLWQFDGPVADLIEYTKYRDELWRIQCLKREIGAWFERERLGLTCPVKAIPVPPSRRRLRQRGFDLPTVLARWFSRQPSVSLCPRALRRIRDGPRQASLGRVQRRECVAGAFQASRSPPSVVLIDDVITTGATISACTKELAEAGATGILVLTLARTPLDAEDPV